MSLTEAFKAALFSQLRVMTVGLIAATVYTMVATSPRVFAGPVYLMRPALHSLEEPSHLPCSNLRF